MRMHRKVKAKKSFALLIQQVSLNATAKMNPQWLHNTEESYAQFVGGGLVKPAGLIASSSTEILKEERGGNQAGLVKHEGISNEGAEVITMKVNEGQPQEQKQGHQRVWSSAPADSYEREEQTKGANTAMFAFDIDDSFENHHDNSSTSVSLTATTSSTLFACDACKIKFSKVSTLHQHQQLALCAKFPATASSQPQPPQQLQLQSPPPAQQQQQQQKQQDASPQLQPQKHNPHFHEPQFKCPHCHSASFTTVRGLTKHTQVMHRHDNLYSCPHCNTCFPSLRAFKIHGRQVHQGRKPDILCDACGVQFKNWAQFRYHAREHNIARREEIRLRKATAKGEGKRHGAHTKKNVHVGDSGDDDDDDMGAVIFINENSDCESFSVRVKEEIMDEDYQNEEDDEDEEFRDSNSEDITLNMDLILSNTGASNPLCFFSE
ncbi:hypothetical protein HK100_009657 [Physocladia obscura]|uniref:C2H2-type domain-containing protein n=1 Tax=Physocladia obscura TaxID=109957 RepID=A0AAD5T365_9FUNG|nr:hypothetical protein HK100_009657 [Physocladia obscura]